jgi:hypothetical protein
VFPVRLKVGHSSCKRSLLCRCPVWCCGVQEARIYHFTPRTPGIWSKFGSHAACGWNRHTTTGLSASPRELCSPFSSSVLNICTPHTQHPSGVVAVPSPRDPVNRHDLESWTEFASVFRCGPCLWTRIVDVNSPGVISAVPENSLEKRQTRQYHWALDGHEH